MFVVARLTIKNHSVHPGQKATYRILIDRVKHMEKRKTNCFDEILGDIADRLGRYEDLGEPEEIAKKLGIRLEG